MARGWLANAFKYLSLTRLHIHLKGIAIETGRVAHSQRTLREHPNDLLIQCVDALTQPGQRICRFDMSGVFKAAQRRRVDGGSLRKIHVDHRRLNSREKG